MERIEQNEYEPPFNRHEEEFFLPVQDYGDLLRKKEEVAREQNFLAPGASIGRKTNRRKRKDSGWSSELSFIDKSCLFWVFVYVFLSLME